MVELNSHTPITILPSDRKEEIVRFLKSIPFHIKKRIREVSIDMRESFRRGVGESLGSNVRIVVDPFPVIRDANRRIDDERKLIQSTHLYYKKVRIKIPKILFLKGIEKLTDKERYKIDYYFNLYPSLKEFYEVKERLRYMFKYMKHEDNNTLSKLIKRISFGLRGVNTYINKVSSLIVPIHLSPHLLT